MRKKFVGSILVLLLSFAVTSQARIIYVDATAGEGGNTTLATGEELIAPDPGTAGSGADGLWRGRVYGNGGTIFESGGSWEADLNTEDCPRLMTTVVVPEDDYEVFVYFWADASQWRIRAALADAEELPLFLANDPNGAAVLADVNDFDAPVPMLTEGNRTLWQVSLGTTGVTTTITVFIDDEANHITGNSRTWYDGIGIKALPHQITYVDATEGEAGNTALAAGGVFTSTADGSGSDNLWRGRAFGNEATIFESGGSYGDTANPEDCPRLVTSVTVPENEYEVFVFFWSDAGQWRIQAALADAEGDLPLFLANDPNGAAVLADVNDFPVPVPMLAEGNRFLWQVSLGKTGLTTSISVYVDDDPNHQTHNARTWYDGIGYKVITPIHYVDATAGEGGNTTLATGEVLVAPDPGTAGSGADGLWRGRAFANGGTIFESGGSWEADLNTEDCPRLLTSVDVPANCYDVYVYFWADASQWRIQASLDNLEGDMPLYLANDPNSEATLAVAGDFAAPVPLLTQDNRTLWQAYVGMTGFTSTIQVYVDDDPNHITGNARTWYDGIGYKVASLYTPDAPPEPEPEPEPEPLPEPVDPGMAGLVAYYLFEGDVADYSGNGLDGTINGAPSYVQGLAKYGMAMDFHATAPGETGDCVDCGASPLFDLVDAMTVGAWVNIRSMPEEWRGVITKGDSAWRIATNAATTAFQFAFTGAGRSWLGATSTTQVAMNEWHYVCGTYDKAVGACIYVDGQLEGTNPDKGGIDVDTFNVWIGANSEDTGYKPGRYFDGMIDEVRLYDRALSQAEVVFLSGQ
jgi:hypothetical protein